MYAPIIKERLGPKAQEVIDRTLLSLAGLKCLEFYHPYIFEKNGGGVLLNSQIAIRKNLMFIGVHAGNKRFAGEEERLFPSTFLAICQYEHMMICQQPYIQANLLVICNDYGIDVVRKFRKFFELPPFEIVDEVVAVETYTSEDDGEIVLIEKVDDIKVKNQHKDIGRALPVAPQAIGHKITRHMGFINTIGSEEKTVAKLKAILNIKD